MSNRHEDTYFLDPAAALHTARRNYRVMLAGGVEQTQMCYYDGPPIPDAPENLVNVPLASFTEFFSSTSYRVPTCVHYPKQALSQADGAELERSFAEMVEQILRLRAEAERQRKRKEHCDSYFFDRNTARTMALQRYRVDLGHPAVDGLQVCYHDGAAFADAPPNLVAVPLERLLDFLTTTRLRFPQSIAIPRAASAQDTERLTQLFQRIVTEAVNRRKHTALQLLGECRRQAPEHRPGAPLRVFLPTSRMTTVMQYCSKNLARAFEKLGHVAHVCVEHSDVESLDLYWRLREQLDFHPDVVVNINHLANERLHPDVWNVTWWQDPMPSITDGKPLPWRERDLVLSLNGTFDRYLEQTGARNVLRQQFCIDTDVFRLRPEIERQDKVVFVGSSYSGRLRGQPEEKEILREFMQRMESGTVITEDDVRAAADAHGLTFEYAYWDLFHYAVRDTTVRWLCETSPLPVEVYGHHWDHDAVVAPFFKGPIPHGAAVAELYNGARYALVSHPFEINSQRLAEAAACGCVPLVYDVRAIAEPPHWNDECLFFRTRAELAARIGTAPPESALALAERFSYERLARRILDLIERGTING